MSDFFRKYGIFLIVPGIVLGFTAFLKLAAGPYWLASNLDPSYQYLVNGLYLIKGYVPNHTDHPGTPLQMLCCVVCWLFNWGRSSEDLVTHVLIDPEFYLRTVFVVLSLFTFFTSFYLGMYVFRKTNDQWAALLTQLPALGFLVMKAGLFIPVVANVSPEALLVGIVNLFNICLFQNYFATKNRDTLTFLKEKSMCPGFLWGSVCGLGVAVKLTFLPVLIVPLIVLSWKNKAIFVCAFAASFFAWTIPILSKYPRLWGWVSGIITHTGTYGTGGAGIIDVHSYFLNWKSIVLGQWVYAPFVFLALALVLWKFVVKKWDKGTFFLLVTMIGVCIQFSVVAKHPAAHYLLPGLGLFSFILVLVYLQWPFQNALTKRTVLIFILITVLLGAWQANAYRLSMASFTRDVLDFDEHVRTKYQGCTIIDYYQSSGPESALFFGDGWNLIPHLGPELFRLYPNEFFLHIWGNKIMSFNDRVWSNDLLAQNSCVLFRGNGDYDFSNSPYDVQLLEKGRLESIHLLTRTTEKQATILITGAIRFFQAGEYAKAMACVLEARKFHYQPDSSIDSLIHLFEPYLQH